VLKTDVASYYASIDHVKLLDRLSAVIPDRDVLNLVGQMLCRVSEGGGLYHEFRSTCWRRRRTPDRKLLRGEAQMVVCRSAQPPPPHRQPGEAGGVAMPNSVSEGGAA